MTAQVVALGYELRGEVRVGARLYSQVGERSKREFTAWGDGDRWQVTLWNTNLLQNNISYYTSKREPETRQMRTLVTCPYWIMGGARGEPDYFGMYDRVRTNHAMVWVATNGPPDRFDRMSAFVWLGLGTITYQGASPDLPPAFPPFGRLYETEDGGKFRARWSKFEEPPHFPRRIVYMNRGYLRTPNAKGGDEQIPLGGAYKDGFEELVLQVQRTTNIGPYVFPLRYDVTRYAPGDASVAYGELRTVESYTVEIFEISTNAAPRDYHPPVVTHTYINDHRLAGDTNIGVVSYSIPDQKWRTLAEVRKIKAGQKRYNAKPEKHPRLMVAVVALVCAPLVVMAGQAWRKRRKEVGAGLENELSTSNFEHPTLNFGGEAGDADRPNGETARPTTEEALTLALSPKLGLPMRERGAENELPTSNIERPTSNVEGEAGDSAGGTGFSLKEGPADDQGFPFSLKAGLQTPGLGAAGNTWAALVGKIVVGHKLLLVGGLLAFIALLPGWQYSVKNRALEKPLLTYADRFNHHFLAQDASNYAKVAQEGYQANTSYCAFYPLWPALMRAGSYVTGGNVVLAGFILANLFSLLAAWLIHDWVARQHGPATAHWSLLFFLVMPGAAFFPTVQTESLFLLLVILCFRWLTAGRFWAAAGIAFLLPLTRPVGIFMVAPLLWELIAQRRRAWDYLCLLVPLAGYATYFGVMYAFTDNPFEGFAAQKFFPNNASLANMVNLAGVGKAFINVVGFHEPTTSALDRALFIGFLLALPWLWRLNRTYFWYALPVGLVPALSNWFMSYTRYLVAVFPLCILLAVHLRQPGRRWLGVSVAAGLLCLQLFLLWRYLTFQWT